MPNMETKSRRILGILGGIGIVVVLAIAGVVWALWYDLNIGFWAPAHPDFKGYSSSATLNGATLQGAKLVRYKEFGMDIWWFDYVLQYGSDGVAVYERSAAGHVDSVASCKGRTSSLNTDYAYICDVHAVKNGGRYMVLTSKYKGEASSVSVEALIGTTELYVSIPSDKDTSFTSYDGWQTYFDSLDPADLQTVPFTNDTHHQGGA